ncbi:hypothetical protein PM082_016557 [Marasmius tenuissimus]|nr:hypothetical protein PM082_016557 [Marasmius tenuissimus]
MWVKAVRWWVKKGNCEKERCIVSDCEKRTCDNHVSKWWREKWCLHDKFRATEVGVRCSQCKQQIFSLKLPNPCASKIDLEPGKTIRWLCRKPWNSRRYSRPKNWPNIGVPHKEWPISSLQSMII